jgi:hypothetical protein
MSADSELLIKIKTILESQGIDAAKAKLTELTQTTNTAGLSEAAVNRERTKSEIQAEKTAKAILAMNGAMQGGMGPFRAAVHVANQLGGSFALLAFKASAIGAAMTIGWNIGTKLREWVTGAKDVEAEMEKLKTVSDELRDRVSKLSDIRLSNLKIEAEGIAKGFSTAVDKAERLKRLSDLREDAQLASNIAEVNLAFQKGEINQETRDRLEVKFQGESERRKLQGEEKQITSEQKTSDETLGSAHMKMTSLKDSEREAQQAYENALSRLKIAAVFKQDSNLSNPEDLANNPQGAKYQESLSNAQSRLSVLGKNEPDSLKSSRTEMEDARADVSTKAFNLYRGDVQKSMEDRLVKATKSYEDEKAKYALAKELEEQLISLLKDLPGLLTVSKSSKADVEAYSPIHKNIVDTETVRQEELSAKKDALVDKYKAHDQTYEAKDQAISSQIEDAKRQKELDKVNKITPAKSSVKRLAAIDLLDSVKLDPLTKQNNAGLPYSEKGQADFDSGRHSDAREAIRMAGINANKGVGTDQVMNDLVRALTGLSARLSGKNSLEPELRKVIDRLDGVEGEVKNIKGQQQTSPGLN